MNMKHLQSLGAFVYVLTVCDAAVRLPAYIKKCDFQDENLNNCVSKSAVEAWDTLTKGDKNVRFHKVRPLQVPKMLLDTDGHLQIKLTECTINGLDEPKNLDINMDFFNKKIIMKAYFESCSIIGHYTINGRILLLPITGNGPANVTFAGGNYVLTMNFDIIEGKGNHYIKILDSDLIYDLKRAYFKLDNLFNGNKVLADQMSGILDENWRDVNAEVGSQVGKGLGDIFSGILREFFARVPLQELFLNFTPL